MRRTDEILAHIAQHKYAIRIAECTDNAYGTSGRLDRDVATLRDLIRELTSAKAAEQGAA